MDSTTYFTQVSAVCDYYGIDMTAKVKDIPREKLDYLLYGTDEILEYNYVSKNGNTRNAKGTYEGIIPTLERRYLETKSGWIRDWLQGFMVETACRFVKEKDLKRLFYLFI